jgi:hypothetical protein
VVDQLAGIDPSLVRRLGSFVPSELDPAAIERELPALLPSCCRTGRIGIRTPGSHPVLAGNLVWHQDDGPAHMVVWASMQPTEIRLPGGAVFAGEPGDLIWFDNRAVWHRQPAATDDAHRWFVAVRCNG